MFKELASSLVGKVIRIDRGGVESRVGRLLAVADDYLVLLTKKDGVVYYQKQHIRSVTDNSKEQCDDSIPEEWEFHKADCFRHLLKHLKYQWVKIHRDGPHHVEGIIADVHHDFLTLINKEEIIHIALYHIHNFSEAKCEEDDEDRDRDRDQDEEKNEKKSESKKESDDSQEKKKNESKSSKNKNKDKSKKSKNNDESSDEIFF